jgi:transposase InsO family protein
VDRQFTETAPNQLWVADVTYVPTVQGWLYLAWVTAVYPDDPGLVDASHRKTDLVVNDATMAVHRRGVKVPRVIHHSNRGGESPLTNLSGNFVVTALWPPWAALPTVSTTRLRERLRDPGM